MPARPGVKALFEGISKLPPDELADLSKRLLEERPRAAAIIGEVLGDAATISTPSAPPPRKMPKPVPARPLPFKAVSADAAQSIVDGVTPHGYDPIIVDENPGDLEP